MLRDDSPELKITTVVNNKKPVYQDNAPLDLHFNPN
jgi:hypothetical protein